MARNVRNRLARLERRKPTGGLDWDNLAATSLGRMTPPGVFFDLRIRLAMEPTRVKIDPIELVIAAAERGEMMTFTEAVAEAKGEKS